MAAPHNGISSFLQHPQGCTLTRESVTSSRKQQGIGCAFFYLTCESPSPVHMCLSSTQPFHSLIILYTHEASTNTQVGTQREPPSDPRVPLLLRGASHTEYLYLYCILALLFLPRYMVVAFSPLCDEASGLCLKQTFPRFRCYF